MKANPIDPVKFAVAPVRCPCGWSGVGAECHIVTDDVVTCPKCRGPVVVDEAKGDE